MLTPDPAFDALRRQAKLSVKAEEAAAAARRDVTVLEQAFADAFAQRGAISRGDQPRCDPMRLLTDADRETSHDVRLRLNLPSGTGAEIRAQRTEMRLSTAAGQARQRANRLEVAARIAVSDFTEDALEFLRAKPLAANAFAAAMTLKGIAAREDRYGQTAERFRSWILGAGVELEGGDR